MREPGDGVSFVGFVYTKGLKSYLLSLKNAELYERKGMLNGMCRMAESERDGVSHRGGRSILQNKAFVCFGDRRI